MSESPHCKCAQPDTEDMVQCDQCDLWYHFGCVGVNSSIADRSWSCERCSQNTPTQALISDVSKEMDKGAQALPRSSPTLETAVTGEHVRVTWPMPATTTNSSTVRVTEQQQIAFAQVRATTTNVTRSNLASSEISSMPFGTVGTSLSDTRHLWEGRYNYFDHLSIPTQALISDVSKEMDKGSQALSRSSPTMETAVMGERVKVTWPMPATTTNVPRSNLANSEISSLPFGTVATSLPDTRHLWEGRYNYLDHLNSATLAAPNLTVTSKMSDGWAAPSLTTRITNTMSAPTFITSARTTNTLAAPTPATSANMSNTQLSQQMNLRIQKLDEEMKLKQQFIEAKYKILSQAQGEASTSESLMTSSLTTEQLATRQIIPKRLPTFNGDPETWPLFISSFESSTAAAGFNNAENLIRLQECLKGKALEMVRAKLCMPNMVPEIISTLRMCFGRPEQILERMIIKARNTPAIKDKMETLVEFAISVKNICATMESCQLYTHMHNPFLVKELVEKLPNHHKLNWAMSPKDEKTPIIKIFSDWLYKLAEAASTFVSYSPNKNSAALNTHTVGKSEKDANQRKGVKCHVCDSEDHKVNACDVFKKATLSERWDYVRDKNICRQCLCRHHRKCLLEKKCGVEGCDAKHHPMLHKIKKDVTTPASKNVQVNAHSHRNGAPNPYFRIVPINIHARNKVIETFAFLDEGSAVTLIEKDTFNKLGVEGELSPLCLRWTGNTTRMESESVVATIQVSNASNGNKFYLKEVRTVESLNLPSQSVDKEHVAAKYPHLKGLPLPSYQDARPKILIGVNNWRLAVPLKVKEGKTSEPIASKCRLGWTLQGLVAENLNVYHLNLHVCDCIREDEQLHEAVKEYFNIENSQASRSLSEDDNRAMSILNETCVQLGNQYEIGLPWRDDCVNLPESFSNALRRLNCLKKRVIKEPGLKETIQTQINNLVTKGYAREITSKEAIDTNGKIWYLPIFVVKNPNKPGKIRLVWDAAAKSNKASLNDFLLTGPDLLNSLVEVLLAFRVGKIAVCGDIAEMFHRINVRESDMHAQRFLWWNNDDELSNPGIYVMRALTFGMNCAPCIAHFVRDKNAESFKDKYPRAVEAVQKYHYVDDFIDSADDDATATELALQVKLIHAAAGFNIRNWTSNSLEVLKNLKTDAEAGQCLREWGATAKVLGMFWEPVSDEFRFLCRFPRLRRDVINETLVPTKRETLQVLMSIYDPLGIVSCHTVGLKILLQEIWRSGIEWDQPLSETLNEKWLKWKATIPLITEVRVPRCYSPSMKSAKEVQLHVFVDAGENAYSTVSYIRAVYSESISVAFVAAKSKVSPLKPLSIPRLELQAAVIGVRLASKILNVQRIHTTSQHYWTDSKTLLQWLRMDPRGLKQFVMHRVGEILERTNVDQWHWVPSKLNPADLATKVSPRAQEKIWLSGPDFLSSNSCNLPTFEQTEKINCDDGENCCFHVTKNLEICDPNIDYFSCWKRLQRAIATFVLYLGKLKANIKRAAKPEYVTTEMYQAARIFLFKYAQAVDYRGEIYNLSHNKVIDHSSKIISLSPYLDDDGILRSKSRAEHLNNHEDAIILPQHHRVTFLIVQWFHQRLHHQMHETVINRIRGQFYVPRLRVLYKSIRRSCQMCRINNAMPRVPQMAALPAARLAAFERPFTFTGIDFFGPLFVAVGRRREKRWGVIFTCMTVRAIHIEVAHNLDTSSCVMAITSFMARRGSPREIYSDNGTNFKAAEKILNDQIKWKFNPPNAPHMGGAWERLIRTIKKVLYSLCPTMRFSDESLRCALNEVEFTINGRPLTFVSIDPSDDEAITPNHLLMGSSDGFKPISSEKVDLRQRWHLTQQFADKFWRRWLKEYIPIITKRNKWFDKKPPIKIGDVVVIVDPDLPRNNWPKGIIVDTLQAKDGQVRTVMVKTKTSLLQRPVTKIAVLDVGCSGKLAKQDSFTGEGMLPPPKV